MKAALYACLALVSSLTLAEARPHPSSGTQYLPHPSGCPARLFCACGAAVKVFGSPRRELWHTSAWRRFPAAQPGPGMVAVNGRHIFVIDRVLGNGMVMAYDYNSGGGRSRYHARSLRGYSVRNPRG
jgi:hypothetical protein